MALVELATQYVQKAAHICVKFTVARGSSNKPNTHRLPELYRYLIPLHMQASIFSDKNFEADHKPLNAALMEHTQRDAHTIAFHNSLCREWFHIYADNSRLASPGNFSTSFGAYKSLRKLLFKNISNTISAEGLKDTVQTPTIFNED